MTTSSKYTADMTQEEKQLLLQDLCGRLPFQVKVAIDFEGYMEVLPDDKDLQYPYRKNLNFILDYDNKTIEDISKEPHTLYAYLCTERFAMLRGYTYELDYGVPVEFIKPYLRPMSSMTKEEAREYNPLYMERENNNEYDDLRQYSQIIDYLNQHHFDYRGLIEKELALEAPEGMYNPKQ